MKISIVVICYNQAQYLSEALQSVLDQSYVDWECIIVNDGSPDNTEEVAKVWCAKDSRFIYLNKENGGPSQARNAGINLATGDWILPLDADDKIASDYVMFAVEAINKDPQIGLVYANAYRFGAEDRYWELGEYDFNKILCANQIYCTAFFKRNDWAKIGGYDEAMRAGREDWEFWINLLSNTGCKVKKIDYLGFYYRIKSESRNIDLVKDESKQIVTRDYIYKKHEAVYIKTFGTPFELIVSNQSLMIKNSNLENSKEYRLGKFLLSPLKAVKRCFFR